MNGGNDIRVWRLPGIEKAPKRALRPLCGCNRERICAESFTRCVVLFKNSMKYLVACICILVSLCGIRLLAVEGLVPDTFLGHTGIYASTNDNVVRQLTIQTNKLWLTAAAGQQSTSAGSYNWIAARHWFVYVGKDMRIWAFNGEHFFVLLEADATKGRTVPLGQLVERPPVAILKRLPRAVRARIDSEAKEPK
jgi:hypothetical protein